MYLLYRKRALSRRGARLQSKERLDRQVPRGGKVSSRLVGPVSTDMGGKKAKSGAPYIMPNTLAAMCLKP